MNSCGRAKRSAPRRSSPPTIMRWRASSPPAAASRSISASPATTWIRWRRAFAARRRSRPTCSSRSEALRSAITISCSARSSTPVWSSGFGASRCGPANRSCRDGLGRCACSACRAIRFRLSSAPFCFSRPCCARWSAIPTAGADVSEPAFLGADVAANDLRQDYLRAALTRDDGGALVATPFPSQDSSLVKFLAHAQAWSFARLMRRPRKAATRAGSSASTLGDMKSPGIGNAFVRPARFRSPASVRRDRRGPAIAPRFAPISECRHPPGRGACRARSRGASGRCGRKRPARRCQPTPQTTPAISTLEVEPEIGAGVIAACAVPRLAPSTMARTARVFIESLQF